jgi:hypothetical protein
VFSISDVKVFLPMSRQVQLVAGDITGHIEWLGMIKEIHGLIRKVIDFPAELCRFSLRHGRRQFMKFVQTGAHNGPEHVSFLSSSVTTLVELIQLALSPIRPASIRQLEFTGTPRLSKSGLKPRDSSSLGLPKGSSHDRQTWCSRLQIASRPRSGERGYDPNSWP